LAAAVAALTSPHSTVHGPLKPKYHGVEGKSIEHSAIKHAGHNYYVYDVMKIPECAYTNKHYYNLTFCLQDDYYPIDTILHELDRNRPLVDRLLSDITYQSADNLVDGLTKLEEEGYTMNITMGTKNTNPLEQIIMAMLMHTITTRKVDIYVLLTFTMGDLKERSTPMENGK